MSDTKTKTKTAKAPTESKTTSAKAKKEETKPKTEETKAKTTKTTKATKEAPKEETKAKTKSKAADKKETKAEVKKEETKVSKKSKKSETEAVNVEYPEMPKSKRSAYTFFFQGRRQKVSEANKGMSFGEITSLVANEWNALSDKEKAKYVKMQEEDVARYEAEKAKWDAEVIKLGGTPKDVKRARAAKKKARRNKVKEPDRPKNAYTFFNKLHREELKGENLGFSEMTKRIAADWKNVSDADKAKYNAMAEEDKKRYDGEMQKFREEHPDTPHKKRKTKEEGHPTGKKNAYIFFTQENRSKIKASNPEMSTTEVMKEMGKLWNALNDKEKSKYEELSNKDNARYEKELAEWKASKAK